jgi:hypothetical protein
MTRRRPRSEHRALGAAARFDGGRTGGVLRSGRFVVAGGFVVAWLNKIGQLTDVSQCKLQQYLSRNRHWRFLSEPDLASEQRVVRG